ncbi:MULTISPECIES: ROK family protein [unclassified Streptomyces]|uniref:ROK family protein n=1 Tax=unclassified Streptomyces TaxID=2593676 RepID=UPI0036EE4205
MRRLRRRRGSAGGRGYGRDGRADWRTGHSGRAVGSRAPSLDGSSGEALDDFAAALVQGVAAVVLTVDPEAVVIGGGLSRAGELLLAPLRSRLAELCLFPVTVVASRLGDEAVAHGALRLALDGVENGLFAIEH